RRPRRGGSGDLGHVRPARDRRPVPAAARRRALRLRGDQRLLRRRAARVTRLRGFARGRRRRRGLGGGGPRPGPRPGGGCGARPPPGPDLRGTMSASLVRDLDRAGVAIRDRSEIAELHGADGRLEEVALKSGERVRLSFLFLFLGAGPNTEWLGDTVARDDRG